MCLRERWGPDLKTSFRHCFQLEKHLYCAHASKQQISLIYNHNNTAIIMYIYLTCRCIENKVSSLDNINCELFCSLHFCISKPSSTMDIIKSDVKNRMKNERKPKYLKYQYNKKHFPPPLLLSPKCFHYFLPFLIISDKEH